MRQLARSEEIRDLSRFTLASAILMLVFSAVGVMMTAHTGDPGPLLATALMIGLAGGLLWSRRRLGRSPTFPATFHAIAVLGSVLVLSSLRTTGPVLSTVPILAIALGLSFLEGRALRIAIVSAVVVTALSACLIALRPPDRALMPWVAASTSVAAAIAVVAITGFVFYRYRTRLTLAVDRWQAMADALFDSEVRYRTVIDDVREIIFRVDADGRCLLVNSAWEELTGHSVAGTIGRPVADFIHPDDLELHAAASYSIARGGCPDYRQELRVLARDGREVWVEARARPRYDREGRFIGVSGTLVDLTVRRELEARLMEQAFNDDLTGLANRALFRDRLQHAMTRRARTDRPLALLFLDLDRFKTVNDSLGHPAGDGLLIAIARRLQAMMRAEDTIARLGGDEFAILTDAVRAADEAVAMAQRILLAFDTPFEVGGRPITIRASIGIVVSSNDQRSADDLLRDADVAMYRAKSIGQGSFALFEPAMQAEIAARLQLELDLREAIENDRLTLVYQPIIDLRDGRVASVEALARWSHPGRGEVRPSMFIPCAEESGLIFALGRWVLDRASRDVAALRSSLPGAENLRLSVNVSPRELGDGGIVGRVLATLHETGLPPSCLDVEVTEGLVLNYGDEEIGRLRALRTAGCGVALDDFGTGFSSLGNLRTLPIDQLKIDRSFVSAMQAGTVDAAVAEAVVALGAALGLTVVAEGIGDAAVARRLVDLGCPFGQGDHFSLPLTIDELATHLAAVTRPGVAA